MRNNFVKFLGSLLEGIQLEDKTVLLPFSILWFFKVGWISSSSSKKEISWWLRKSEENTETIMGINVQHSKKSNKP